MVVPSANMTRSFINPKDRAAEVAKRRQEFEAELQRRREGNESKLFVVLLKVVCRQNPANPRAIRKCIQT